MNRQIPNEPWPDLPGHQRPARSERPEGPRRTGTLVGDGWSMPGAIPEAAETSLPHERADGTHWGSELSDASTSEPPQPPLDAVATVVVAFDQRRSFARSHVDETESGDSFTPKLVDIVDAAIGFLRTERVSHGETRCDIDGYFQGTIDAPGPAVTVSLSFPREHELSANEKHSAGVFFAAVLGNLVDGSVQLPWTSLSGRVKLTKGRVPLDSALMDRRAESKLQSDSPTSGESQPVDKLASFADLAVPSLEVVAPELALIAARLADRQVETAREVEALLLGMEGRTFGSAAEAVAFARGLRRLLTSLEQRVACTGGSQDEGGTACGRPAYLECTPTKAAPYWTLRFRHSPMDKGENAHGYFHQIPRLQLLPAPPDRRRKS